MGAGSVETGQARFDEIRIGCLNFRDFYFLRFGLQSSSGVGRHGELDPLKASQAATAYLLLGGFPAHVHADKESEARRLVRQDIADKAIVKDLQRVARGDTGLLRDLFVSLVEESGSMFDASKWSRTLSSRLAEGEIFELPLWVFLDRVSRGPLEKLLE